MLRWVSKSIFRPTTTSARYIQTTLPRRATRPNHNADRDADVGHGSTHIQTVHNNLRSYIGAAKNGTLDDQNIEKHVLGLLVEEENLRPSLRPFFHDSTISVLMQQRCILEACTVYQRMLEKGYTPSPQTTIKMNAAAAFFMEGNFAEDEDAEDTIMSSFVDPDYTEESLREFLDASMSRDVPPAQLERVVDRFLQSRGPTYKPSVQLKDRIVRIQVRTGNLSSLGELLFSHSNSADEDPKASLPFATLLNEVNKLNPSVTEAPREILRQIANADITIDLVIFNIMLKLELQRNNLPRVFLIYQLIQQYCEKHPNTTPDRMTYGTMFTALHRINRHLFKHSSHRTFRMPPNARSARKIFADMMASHNKLKEKSALEVLDPRVLTTALRTFLSARDYAGAFIVCRAFVAHHYRPSARTYCLVIKHLMNRVALEIQSVRNPGDKRKWAERFLGIRAGEQVDFGDGLLTTHVLEFGTWASMDKSRPPPMRRNPGGKANRSEDKSYNVPSLDMMSGETFVPYHIQFDMTPLLRILRHAILAEFDTEMDILPGAPPMDLTPAQIVSNCVRAAREQMVHMEDHPDPERDVPAKTPAPEEQRRNRQGRTYMPRQATYGRAKVEISELPPVLPPRTSSSGLLSRGARPEKLKLVISRAVDSNTLN